MTDNHSHLTSYTTMIYIFHIIFIAIPLLYYGFKGQHEGNNNMFKNVFLSMLGGMAIVFHGYWLIVTIIKYYKNNK